MQLYTFDAHAVVISENLPAKRINESGSPPVIDNIRVHECAQEITCRPVISSVKAVEELIFASCTHPLRFEMYSRNSKDELFGLAGTTQ